MQSMTRLVPILAIVVLAGCLAGPSAPVGDNTSDPADTIDADTGVDLIENETDVALDFGESNLGENENPHGVSVVNNEDTEVSITLHINTSDGKEVNRSYVLAPGAEVHSVLDYKANYTVTVTGEEKAESEDLQYTVFDCNSSNTTFNFTDGELNVHTVSTMAYCPPEPPQ